MSRESSLGAWLLELDRGVDTAQGRVRSVSLLVDDHRGPAHPIRVGDRLEVDGRLLMPTLPWGLASLEPTRITQLSDPGLRHAYFLFRSGKSEGCAECYVPLLLSAVPIGSSSTARPDVELIVTFERDSIWEIRDRPATISEVEPKARTLRLDGRPYRYQEVSLEEAIRLLRNPLGTIPISRPMSVDAPTSPGAAPCCSGSASASPDVATLADTHRFPTSLPVIVANSVPIVGVLAFGWDLRSIMFLYWLETAVVAFYSVLKIVTVGGLFTLMWLPVQLAMFGVFMSFHLMMILPLGPTPQGGGLFPPALVRDLFARTWGAGVGLLVSHGISFGVNFLGNREYLHTTVNAEAVAPWKRLFIMHVTTLVGAWSVMLFEAPIGALIVLSLLKIVVDLHGHLAERPTPSEAVPRPAATPATKLEGALRLFGAFLVFCALVLAIGTCAEAYRAERVRTQWPTVNAEVLECGVRENVVDRGRNVSHTVRCRFRYEAAGAEHIGTLWTHSTRSPETALAMRRWVGHHRKGTVQPIHYDPSGPDRISLGELGETIDPPLLHEKLTAAGGFAGGGALMWFIVLWRSRRSRRPEASTT